MRSTRLLIDANVLLDVLMKREPFYKDSAIIWKLCETGISEGVVSALTFADIVYVMRKELSPERIQDTLRKLSMIFRFDDLKAEDLENAAKLCWEDYEDALQYEAAVRNNVDYIITRNAKDYSRGRIDVRTPEEFLAEYQV